ncbi:MAG: hypothetical protein MI923_13815 [Phycisphaerales bacterium]|nr:hypothetical protein [Phycisphaerales bacterium]
MARPSVESFPYRFLTGKSRSRRLWFFLSLLLIVAIVLPFLLQSFDPYRNVVVIAGGAEGSRFHRLASALALELRKKNGLGEEDVEVRTTEGAVDNLQLLLDGEAHFGFYQPSLDGEDAQAGGDIEIRFISNLYAQPVHLILRKGMRLSELADQGGVVKVGPIRSADHELGGVLAKHLGIESVAPVPLKEILDADEAETDAVIVSAGITTPMLPGLLDPRLGHFMLHSLPYVGNLTQRFLVLSHFKIEKGFYYSSPSPVPPDDIETVSVNAQLLTGTHVSRSIVEDMTVILLDRNFQRRHQLGSLYRQGPAHEFSRQKPPFALHDGAFNIYEPDLKPFLSPDFVDATEGVRSFVVSIVIGIFVAFRWFRHLQRRGRESRLDIFMRDLLSIERAQVTLDQTNGYSDLGQLQKHLGEVTELRQRALDSFNTYQMTDEPGVDLFLEMSHAVSEKISAKISRQRLDLALADLKRASGTTTSSSSRTS